MELRYVGPHDAVEVHLPDGSIKTVPRNGKLEAAGAVADELLATDNWHRWAEPSQKASTTTSGTARADAEKEG